MAIHTVHLSSRSAESGAEIVNDGFCWPAFLVPPLWLLSQRAWLPALGWLVAQSAIVAVLASGRIAPEAALVLSMLPGLYFGFAGSDIRRASMTRRGQPVVDVIVAPDHDAAELAFFNRNGTPDFPVAPMNAAITAPGTKPAGNWSLGMFSSSDERR